MPLEQIRNSVLFFSNPVWTGANTVPSTLIRNITAISSSLAYQDTLTTNLTTLTTTNLQARDGVVQGFLYVPDIAPSNPCYEQQYEFIPRNVTTQAELPPSNYNLIALAPWFNATCTQAYLAAARLDPIRGFIFYRPNNSTREPQGIQSPIWDLDDDGAWQTQNQFPVFAIPGHEGAKMMTQLSLYSGDPNSIPFSNEIAQRYEPNDRDFIRIWTELSVHDAQNLPAMWTWILIVTGALLFIVACVSITMHLVQRQRRASLRRRVISGEVDLEAMGIKRMTVPARHIQTFPLFTYSFQPDLVRTPSITAARSLRSSRSARTDHRTMSDFMSTSRTRRSSITSTANTIATNYQPHCHICLEQYEDRETIIRELACGHIFHPECIDEFLSLNSSLCPICKKNMLPRGYCPKITNGMVRRERAIRKLRERVVLDDSDVEEGEAKKRKWTEWIFHHNKDSPKSDVEMNPVTPVKDSPAPPAPPTRAAESQAGMDPSHTPPVVQRTLEPPQEDAQEDAPRPDGDHQPESQPQQQPPVQAPRPVVAVSRSTRRSKRQKKARNIHLRPLNPNDPSPSHRQPEGRKSPSALARQRMRTLAGTPLDDPDGRGPLWKRAFTKVFPGFT